MNGPRGYPSHSGYLYQNLKSKKKPVIIIAVVIVLIIIIIILAVVFTSRSNVNSTKTGEIDLKTGTFHKYGEWFSLMSATNDDCANRSTLYGPNAVCIGDHFAYIAEGPVVKEMKRYISADGGVTLKPMPTGTYDLYNEEIIDVYYTPNFEIHIVALSFADLATKPTKIRFMKLGST